MRFEWPFWVAGLALGILVTLLAWVAGKGFGVSSGYGTLCSLVSRSSFFMRKPFAERWRLWFLIGLPLSGLAATLLSGDAQVKHQIGGFETVFGTSLWARAGALVAGGFMIGWGARAAGGCTSGHAILGVSLGSRASLAATAGFMIAGIVVTNLLFGFFGG